MAFADTLRDEARRHGIRLPHAHHPEPFAELEPVTELRLKDAALERFWSEHGLKGRPDPVVASPVPRGYRTTTKRRKAEGSSGLVLGFPGVPDPRAGLVASALDEPSHGPVYELVLEQLAGPSRRALATALNHVVVRGAAGGLTVILNLRSVDAPVVRGAKQLAEAFQGSGLGIRAALLYVDPTESDYYLEAKRPATGLRSKRLFGPEWLETSVGDTRLRFPATAFSQVNAAILPLLTNTVARLLGPLAGASLLDLYCGYGLFALTIGRSADRVLAIDVDGPAIEAGQRNAEHLGVGSRVRFMAGSIDRGLVSSRIRPATGTERVILDPPRQGTRNGVVEAIAARRPKTVVHLVCGADELPREVGSWLESGYRLDKAIPVDVFAGTANLETLLLLTR
jgi:tRNA/tmRNA/rRNA uracil-C5-methylase (TrmA/RlmC/RlmD family)